MVDQSAVGRSFTPVTARVEPGRLRYFLNTLGERNPVYRDELGARAEGYSATPVPPTYLFCLEMINAERPFEFLTELKIDLARVLHGEQSFTYHAPVVVGDTLTFKSRVTDVADKKGGAMTMAALIAGMLVFRQDLFKELSLLRSEMKNGIARITTAVFQPTNNIAGAFAAIPVAAAPTEESTSDPEASARAVDQLKRHANTFALTSDDPSLPKGAVNSDAMVSPGKTDSQERAVDVRDSPRVIDQVNLETLVAPPVATAPPRWLDADELAALMKRAKSLIAVGDIAPARLLLERAAEAQEASAALLLAETYDPAVLGTQDMRSMTPDPAKARSWYEKAVQFGSKEAQQRLAQMQN